MPDFMKTSAAILKLATGNIPTDPAGADGSGMTKTLRRTTRFKKDHRREKKTHADLDDVLKPVIACLSEGKALPRNLRDHPLGGNWKGHRDCHIKPDLVLIYSIVSDSVTLYRIGSHSELF